jgi:pilus assembly protein Flp/PilA
MNALLLKIQFIFRDLTTREGGQDLVEYALLVSLIAIAAVAGLHTLATKIVGVFTSIDTSL